MADEIECEGRVMEIAGSPIELLNIPLKSWIKNGTRRIPAFSVHNCKHTQGNYAG
jgi:hypothetical protein